MTTVSLSDEGEETLENIRDTFEIKPSKRKVVERALDQYEENRVEDNNEPADNPINN